jgi:hypothetical protein
VGWWVDVRCYDKTRTHTLHAAIDAGADRQDARRFVQKEAQECSGSRSRRTRRLGAGLLHGIATPVNKMMVALLNGVAARG